MREEYNITIVFALQEEISGSWYNIEEGVS